jgi:Dolichyl-phosphate-mannose-protein mannosyltransferase
VGMLILVAVVGPARAGSRRTVAAAAAAGMVLAVAAVLAVAFAPALLRSGIGIPEGPRLLLVAAPLAIVVASSVAWVASTPAERREWRAGAIGPGAVLAGIVAAFAVIVVAGMLQQAPLSWDESAYAITTRHWAQGGPSTGMGVTRPPVVPVLGLVPIAFGTQEWQFRVIGLLFGMGAIVAAWFLASSIAGSGSGLLAGLLLAAAPSLQVDAGLFLTDVPATALLLLLLALVWRAFEAPQPPGWGLLWLAPLAAAAFYTRYGSIVPLAAIALSVPLLWPARARAAWRPVLATAGLVGLLLLPHAVTATFQRGSPLGIILVAQGGAAGESFGSGLVQYLAWMPVELIGLVPGLAAVLGLAVGAGHLIRAAARRGWDSRARSYGLLVIPAAIHAGVLGLVALPQQRYLFLPMALLVVAGAVAVARVAVERGRVGRLAFGAVALAGVAALTWSGITMPARADGRTAFMEWERRAGLLIREMGEGSCSVLASDYPQMTWYSGCPAYNFADLEEPGRERLLSGQNRFLVLRRDGQFQPVGEVLDAYLALVEPMPVAELRNRDGHVVARVYRFAGS